MKKIYLIIVTILITLNSLLSCSNDRIENSSGVPQPLQFYFLVNKNSEEYKNLVKAFDKGDYTSQPKKEKGYNNVYFTKGDYKAKLRSKLFDSDSEDSYAIELYKHMKIEENYAFLMIAGNEFYANTLTGKEENLILVYDDKEIPFKIKGTLIEGGSNKWAGLRAIIDEFYVNNKNHRFLRKGQQTYDCVLYLVE